MEELIKISEVSLKYDISTRALRYYEDKGLIESIRTEDYAYRLYDDIAIKRIEQILVLRKLNISIKDIKKIFSANSVDVILEVLGSKVNVIDEEITLLYELKEIVVTIIKQLEKSDVESNLDLIELYEKANEIDTKLMTEKQDTNQTAKKLLEVTSKLERMPDIRIIELPNMKMARSGHTDLSIFDEWWSRVKVPQSMFPRDFMWYNTRIDCFEWLFVIPDDMSDTNGYEVFDFPGGLYAVATAYDEGEEINRINTLVHKWVHDSDDYEEHINTNEENERYDMGHVITPIGVSRPQMDLFIPIIRKVD
ncbi:MAG: MerR family transcriptional regulator [Clostridiales bacterium]|nr:MerR family transcriptional regulator [Clostridiales bacterium]